MNILKFFSVQILVVFFTLQSYAQELSKASIQVWGSCGMCKERIEKTALEAGAQEASWDENSKMLRMTYPGDKVSLEGIQEALAKVGHDTKDLRANDEAYAQLPGCCQYERKQDHASNSTDKKCVCSMKSCSDSDEDCRKHKACVKANCCKVKSSCEKDNSSCQKDKSSCNKGKSDGHMNSPKAEKCCEMKGCSRDSDNCKKCKDCQNKGCCKG